MQVKLHQIPHGVHSFCYSIFNCHCCSVVGEDTGRFINFIVNILLGISVLMWFLVSFIWQIIYNCWWYITSSANELVTVVWSYMHLLFVAIIQILGTFGLLSLNTTHLALRILYYVFLLWVFSTF